PAPYIQIADKAGIGHGCSEAPRGILYHRYEVDAAGLIKNAVITPPTAQNQPQIEDDLRHFFPSVMEKPEEEATLRCEQLIRNYDPCISCSTHFLKLKVDRTT
ncbi:MAG: nickel-dependent hydrogenase large subunit, partial [Phycisphaerales bacterium]|nr:nickel-dependent hydrogenase large subunit [Phycisphaerales bacterium]